MKMNTNVELKPGWLKSDLVRASKRVQELKIAKSHFSNLNEEDVQESAVDNGQHDDSETLQC
jgi:hypothetical protein